MTRLITASSRFRTDGPYRLQIQAGTRILPRWRSCSTVSVRLLLAVVICMMLLSAAIAPDRTPPPSVSAATVSIGEVRTSSGQLYVERPIGASEGLSSVFRVSPDREELHRVTVEYGHASTTSIQILSGLSRGDQIVVSDMRAWDAFQRLRLR